MIYSLLSRFGAFFTSLLTFAQQLACIFENNQYKLQYLVDNLLKHATCSKWIVHSSKESINLFLPGHIFSSTSQKISSLAMQQGEYLLEWQIYSLQDSAVMSPHAASMAAGRAIWVCGRWS